MRASLLALLYSVLFAAAVAERMATPRGGATATPRAGATSRAAKTWTPAVVLGPLGSSPWGNVFARPAGTAGGQRGIFQVLPGFQVERLYTVPKGQQGSWVCLTHDGQGRLLACECRL